MHKILTFNLPSENDCFPNLPSTLYNDLTLEASSTIYTAPANGYFNFRKLTTAASQCLATVFDKSDNLLYIIGTSTVYNASAGGLFIPVLKGYKVRIEWDVNSTLQIFRFIYAKGQSSVIKY